MSTGRVSQPNMLDLAGDEPIILVGEPKSLRGELRLRNPTQDKITLREAYLRLHQPDSDQPALFVQVALSATLQPDQAQQVKFTLDIDRHTPPGEYQGELKIAGHTHPVIAHITEVVRLTLSPQSLVIDQGAGTTVVKRVVLGNEGNVPLTIGRIGRVVLGQELLLRRSMSATVAAAGEKPTRPLEKFFAELIRDEAKTILSEVGFLEVSNLANSVVLQPGEVRPLDLEIRLPEKLEAASRYIGRVPLYTSDLEFIVVPVAD